MNTALPNYIEAFNSGLLSKKAAQAQKMLECCQICPRRCKVNRTDGGKGRCRTARKAIVYSFFAHHGEEPAISGENGSGAIFFGRCNMECIYCQNYSFSQEEEGREMETEEIASCMLSLQEEGCHNINLITPTHVMPQILQALLTAAQKGLRIPIVYNTSGYELKEMVAFLDGLVDIYLTDLRYADSECAGLYSGASDYPEHNREAIKEMHRQTGKAVFDENGVMLKGVIVRHLVLPEDKSGTRKALEFLANEVSKDTYISLMSQYFPAHKALGKPPLDRKPFLEEFRNAVEILEELGLSKGWVQESGGLERFAGTNIKRNV